VRAAIADSRVAIARAEKLKKEVQSYGGRVESVNADLQSSTQQLQIAQQRVIEKTILAKLSVVRAPSTGRVLQVSRVAADVAPGDAVVSISRPDQFKAYFADTSGYWKQLRKGSILPIVVRPSGVAEGAPTASATAGASVTAGASATGGAPATARVESIQPPSAAGQPAIVMVLVSNSAPGGASGGGASGGDASESTPSASALAGIANPHLASGATVVFQAPQSSVALVPEEALLRRADAVLAAVLKPEALSGAYSVEWRFVQPGETNGAQCEVLDGLREGERVVLQPRELYKYSVAQDGPALLRLIS